MANLIMKNGQKAPLVGFGCYNPAGEDFYMVVRKAVESGYRFFDTASLYGTEEETGKALLDSGLKREELFIQSKMWIDEMGYEATKVALERTLNRLKTDYLDVYLIHWPRQTMEQMGAPGHPEIVAGMPAYKADPDWKKVELETYRALEEAYKEGKIRGIGLSNFLPHHLMNILDNCKVKPVVDQLELHIGYMQETAVSFAKAQGITVEAWSPFARGAIIKDPFVAGMAKKYGVTNSQLALRFLVQSDIIPLPKSSSVDRQKNNLDLFDFEIEMEDYYMLACMVPAFWQGEHPDFVIPGVSSH